MPGERGHERAGDLGAAAIGTASSGDDAHALGAADFDATARERIQQAKALAAMSADDDVDGAWI